eukprot:2783689-Rhodomonas_salina.1
MCIRDRPDPTSLQPNPELKPRVFAPPQVLKNLVQGQLRICDTNVFAYKQLQEARAHGFRGRGKALSVSVHLKDEHYKAVIRTVECHSRQVSRLRRVGAHCSGRVGVPTGWSTGEFVPGSLYWGTAVESDRYVWGGRRSRRVLCAAC